MKEKIKLWWCNPGRWTLIVIYLGLVAWFVGMLLVNGAIKNLALSAEMWREEMAEDRANLQSQIDFLESRPRLMEFPEEGP